MLEWRLTDLSCKTIAFFDQRKEGSQVIWPHCGQRRATLRISYHEPAAELVKALGTALYVTYNGFPLFHGPCLDPVFRGEEGLLEVPAVDATEWLARAFRTVQATYTSTSQEEILRQAAFARPFDPGFMVPLRRIIRGTIIPSGVNRAYLGEVGQPFWQTFTDLNGLLGGPEFLFTPLPPDEFYGQEGLESPQVAAWAKLDIASYITGTGKTSAVTDPADIPVFEYACGDENAADMHFASLGSSVKNRVRGRGQQDSSGAMPTGDSDHPASIAEIGSWEAWESTNFTNSTAVKAHAQQQAAAYGEPVPSFTVIPAMEWMGEQAGKEYGYPPVFMEQYAVGDVITARGQYGNIIKEKTGRVTQVEVTEADSHGNVKIGLTCVPRVVAGGVT